MLNPLPQLSRAGSAGWLQHDCCVGVPHPTLGLRPHKTWSLRLGRSVKWGDKSRNLGYSPTMWCKCHTHTPAPTSARCTLVPSTVPSMTGWAYSERRLSVIRGSVQQHEIAIPDMEAPLSFLGGWRAGPLFLSLQRPWGEPTASSPPAGRTISKFEIHKKESTARLTRRGKKGQQTHNQ